MSENYLLASPPPDLQKPSFRYYLLEIVLLTLALAMILIGHGY